MLIVLFAILFLFILIFFGRAREGFTPKDLFDIQEIINDADIPSSDEKMKLLYGEESELNIVDVPILNILKDTTTDNDEKINNLKLYFINLVNERNNNSKSIYKTIPNKISSEKLFQVNNLIHDSELDNSEKIDKIKDLGINDKSFMDIIENDSITDDVKIFGNDTYSGPTLSYLINQITFATFDTATNDTESEKSKKKNSNIKKLAGAAKKIGEDAKKMGSKAFKKVTKK
jgi:hypothetical protein